MIARHATAESFAADDHARRLTPRGEAEARRLGASLVEQSVVPEAALVSDAVRTASTWEQMLHAATAAGSSWRPTVALTRAVYGADEESLLQLIRECDPSAEAVVVVGHNPTVASLALLLEDGDGDARAAAALVAGFPPASAAVFTVTREWSELTFGTATLRAYLSPHQG